ncbi:metallophosphoesterase [Paracoccaceae bacterium]|nr:metallophosphoesterase [Paracoccaceae bacterium]
MAGLFASIWAFFIEPALRLRVKKWQVQSPKWTAGGLKIAIVSDLHMGEPYVGLARLRGLVRRTNALGADISVILGDLTADHRFVTQTVAVERTAEELGALSAPLGVFAVLGNHDWWDDPAAQKRRKGPVLGQCALEANNISVLENQAIKLEHEAGAFWLAGLGDQLAFRLGNGRFQGVDDLPATLAQILDDSPVILLAHEPDTFPEEPQAVALTLSGHTHGGQVRLFGWSPIVPSRYGNRYAYGHIHENHRDLVVSGGVGCSIAPVRFGVTPEITLVHHEARA